MIPGSMSKKKERLSIDWDATCVTECWPHMGEWLPGAPRALKTLAKHYEIVIHTLRVAPVLQDEVTPHKGVADQVAAITAMLEGIGLHGIEVWQRPYKPPCVHMVDDRAIEFTGNWSPIVRRLTRRLV